MRDVGATNQKKSTGVEGNLRIPILEREVGVVRLILANMSKLADDELRAHGVMEHSTLSKWQVRVRVPLGPSPGCVGTMRRQFVEGECRDNPSVT